jgi:asparagine synthase (glutamine-hydrolysing)
VCGIAGLFAPSGAAGKERLRAIVAAMTTTLVHRGPDGEGAWVDEASGVALGHRRLSLLDLSPAGAQPMTSASGRFVISYNGEIFHRELRAELEGKGHGFRGHSDTEVILEAFSAWGVEPTLHRLVGMFAFALWDRQKRSLTLVRDRMGIKPLYWGVLDKTFAFASELKALRAVPGFRGEVDRDALTAFMRYCYVPAPKSIYRGIYKLEPGTIMVVDAAGHVSSRRFWNTRAVAVSGARHRIDMSDTEATDRLDALLRDAVMQQMLADVPMGAFLSGGIDSSVVAAHMQAASEQPARTFSIGFDEHGYDEAPHAAAVARHLGTQHTELYVTSAQARDIIPSLPRFYDEPFADSSQIATHLVSRLARNDVTVALSGDGGDELLAGYTRYFAARNVGTLPRSMRKNAQRAVAMLSSRQWDVLAKAIPRRWRPRHFGQRLHKLGAALQADDANDFYRLVLSHWSSPHEVVRDGCEPPHILDDASLANELPVADERMQFIDMVTYLPDDILTKVDRASMALGLEVRVPLLDHRIVAFAASLPQRMRIRRGQSKWLLRQVLYRYVPKGLVDRPKMGFGVPIDGWLRGPLRDWAEALLDRARLQAEGFLHPAPIREKWAQHLAGTADWQYLLWDVLMFEAWLEEQRSLAPSFPATGAPWRKTESTSLTS